MVNTKYFTYYVLKHKTRFNMYITLNMTEKYAPPFQFLKVISITAVSFAVRSQHCKMGYTVWMVKFVSSIENSGSIFTWISVH